MVRWFLALAICFGLSNAVLAGPDGRVRVIDADTIAVGGQTVRIFGIDAPEADQTCTRPDGSTWACGAWATEQVRAAYEGRRVACEAIERDRYDRIVARCFAGGADIAMRIVRSGWATAYQRFAMDYVEAEKEAVIAARGIFSGRMQQPGDFRQNGGVAAVAAPAGCAIKGNISNSGRIYHMPGQENYNRTRIDTSRGERWFCSQAEARAAGWRAARR